MAKHFNLSKIVDGWNGTDELEDGTLALTSVPNIAGAIHFNEAMKQISSLDFKFDNECQCQHFQIVGKQGFICESSGRISESRCQQSQAQFFEDQ